MAGRRFRSIKAWQKTDDLAALVYELTQAFPREELYGLTSQMRRAAVSAAANIAEGSARRSRQEYLQFLSVARGSLTELSYYGHLAQRLGLLVDSAADKLNERCDEAARVLYGLTRAVTQEATEGVSRVQLKESSTQSVV